MWPNLQETADLIIFTEEILNGKLHFLCSVKWGKIYQKKIYWEKINISIINWEKVFNRFADHKIMQLPWLVNFNTSLVCHITSCLQFNRLIKTSNDFARFYSNSKESMTKEKLRAWFEIFSLIVTKLFGNFPEFEKQWTLRKKCLY